MKKTLLFVGFILLGAAGFAAFKAEKKQKTASEFNLQIGSQDKSVSMADFVEMKDEDYEMLTGQKLGLFGRMQFHQQQRSLRKLINSDGTIDENEAAKTYKDLDRSKGFNLTGFMMGLTLSLVGVASMYIVKDERRKNRATWAWVGAAFWVLFLVLLIAFV